MLFNVLNGDSLAYSFPTAEIEGNLIIMRECLVEGDLSGTDLSSFWKVRAGYLGVSEADYNESVVGELEKMLRAGDHTVFNLWFEYDLFCQVNMWFLLSLIHQLPINKQVFAVYTKHIEQESRHFWNGYGPASTEELRFCYKERIAFSDADILLGHQLWVAYRSDDLEKLRQLSIGGHSTFPHLQAVVAAHVDRFSGESIHGRPGRVISEILERGVTDFEQVFAEFWKTESIYGFGDTQVKRIYDRILRSQKEEDI